MIAQLVKNPPCNAGDPGLLCGLGRSAGEGIGYPLQYSWASLVAHLVKNLPAMRETWVRSLGWEDPLEEGMATHFSIFAWTRMLAWDTLSSIKWTEEPSELEFMASQRVGHN